jgi:amino acid adenylation domain-containing protein
MDRLAQRIANLSPEKRKLLERLLAKEKVDTRQALILPRPAGMAVCPLSFAQQRLWVLHQLDPASPLYNVAFVLRFRGRIDGAALRRAHLELVRRHEILRTTFQVVDSRPAQVVAPPPDEIPAAAEIDLTGLPPDRREAKLEELAAAEALRPFDLARGPLHRATWVRLGEADHAGVVTLHHLLTDGWSLRLYLQELVAVYEAFARGDASSLPPSSVQYADYAVWQRERLRGERLEKLVAWWKGRLAGLRPLDLPADRPRPAVASPSGGRVGVGIGLALVEALHRLARAEGATLFMALLAAFQVLLHRLSGQDDLAVGSPVANRDRKEVERVIGFFVNMLVLRTDLSGDPTFRELLRRVRAVALEAYEHQEVPFEKLVEEVHLARDPSRHPLFQVVFAFDKGSIGALERPDLSLAAREIDTHTSRFDLMLALTEDNGGLQGHLEFRRDLFDDATAARWVGHLRVLLEAIAIDPDRRISELPLLTADETRQLLAWSRSGHKPDASARGESSRLADASGLSGPGHQPDASAREEPCTLADASGLPAGFEEQAARAPDAVAVTCEGALLTYGELNAWANRLAHRLRGLGVGPGACVGLFAERSAALVAGVLGILKAGAAYMPIDTRYPDDRAAFMLADAAAPVVLTQRDLASRLEGAAARPLFLEDDAAGECCEDLPPAGHSGDPAYVIYTSGSTGRPKGVVITHANAVRLFRATEAWMGFGPADVWTLFHSIAFDFSVWELWGALLYGGRLVVVPYWTSRSPADFHALLVRERVTVLNQTPSAFRQLIRAEEGAGPGQLALRLVIFGGEALDFQGLRPWLERHGDRRPQLVNMYGITETTVHVTYHPVALADLRAGASVIGVPIRDRQVYVLDGKKQLCPVGAPGELYIGGGGVARGYLNRPALTAERFVPDPWSPDPSARLYRSGDLARWLPGGRLEYLGRIDQQVKVRGFRIELGEIEAQLSSHPGMRECVVVCREDVRGDRRLVAYVVGRDGQALDAADLRARLRERLPEYMVPSAFVALSALPLNGNGKVDRCSLPAPAGRAAVGCEHVAPCGPVEEALAAIWSSVLGVERVGAADNFFELGGNSLLAAQVVSRIRQDLAAEVPLRALFEAPTVAGLATAVDNARESGLALPAPPVEALPRPLDRPASFPLSFAQQRLWFLHQLQPSSPAYNIPAAVRLSGPLDVEALRRAVREIVRRHEDLRTTFAITASGDVAGPVQVVVPAPELPLHLEDLSELPPAGREAEVLRRARAEAQRPFDLVRGPLLRMTLLRLGEFDHAALLVLHHIVGDGWSLGVLMRELAILYQAYREGGSSPLPGLPVQYADFAVWQRQRLRGEVLDAQVAYWKERLASVPPLDFPTDRPRPAIPNWDGAEVSFTLPQPLAEALRGLARREGATLFMTLLAAFQALLQRCTGQDDFAVGSPVAGRNRKEIEGLIGFFVNTLVLRADLSGDPTFRELLSRVRETCLGAYAHQDVPFEKLVDELHPARDLSRSPLFQVVFGLQTYAVPEVRVPGLGLEPLALDSGAVKFELVLAMTDDARGLRGELKYRTDLFDAATMERLVAHFHALLEGVAADRGRRLSDLPLTAHGKIDRRPPPARQSQRPDLSREYIAPRTDLECLLAERLGEMLGLERVGVLDNFFEVGGDSIKGALLINQLQQELQATVHVAALFDAPTIAQLAAYLEQQYPQTVARVLNRETPVAPADDGPPVDEAQVAEARALVRTMRPVSPHQRGAEPQAAKNRRAVFILSPPRSGSTLLRVMLAGHPRLFAPPELELLSFKTLSERREAFSGRDSFWQEGALRAVMELCRCDAGHARQVMAAWEVQGWTTQHCYRQMQEWLGERLLVDKTPSYALDEAVLRRVEEEFEGPLYIHLLRHPCGMIHSFEEVKLDQVFFRCDHPFTRARLAELIWVVSHQNILAFLDEVPAGRHCRVRFEDLVRQPEMELRPLCRFLGLPFEPAVADPYREPERRMTDGLYTESRMLGDVKFHQHRGVDPAVATRWVGRCSEQSLGLPTRSLAATLGYDVGQADGHGANGRNGFDPIRPLARDGGAGATLAGLDDLSDAEIDAQLKAELAEQGAADE